LWRDNAHIQQLHYVGYEQLVFFVLHRQRQNVMNKHDEASFGRAVAVPSE
jgi:hypothetical protein